MNLHCISRIWQDEVPVCLHQDGHCSGWQNLCKDIQKLFFVLCDGHVVFD